VGAGDRILLLGGREGRVIGIIERAKYEPGIVHERWAALRAGTIVRLDAGELLHCRESHLDLVKL
jgi:hypothetical protein